MPPSILLPLRLPLPCPHTHLPWLLPLPYFDLILSQSLRLDEGLWEVSMPCPPFLLQTQAASQTGEHFKNQTSWATWFRVCPPSRSQQLRKMHRSAFSLVTEVSKWSTSRVPLLQGDSLSIQQIIMVCLLCSQHWSWCLVPGIQL